MQRGIVNTVAKLRHKSVQSSRVNKAKNSWATWPLKMGTIGFPETSVTDYQSTLRNIPEEQRLKNAITFIIVVMGNSTRRHNSRLQIMYAV